MRGRRRELRGGSYEGAGREKEGMRELGRRRGL